MWVRAAVSPLSRPQAGLGRCQRDFSGSRCPRRRPRPGGCVPPVSPSLRVLPGPPLATWVRPWFPVFPLPRAFSPSRCEGASLPGFAQSLCGGQPSLCFDFASPILLPFRFPLPQEYRLPVPLDSICFRASILAVSVVLASLMYSVLWKPLLLSCIWLFLGQKWNRNVGDLMFWLFWTGICFFSSRASIIVIGIYLMLKRLLKKKFSLLLFQLSFVKQSLHSNYFAAPHAFSILWKAVLPCERWLLQKWKHCSVLLK